MAVSKSAADLIQETAARTDLSQGEVEAKVDEKLDEWQEEGRLPGAEETEELRRHAASVVNSELNIVDESSVGEAVSIPTLALGFKSDAPPLYDGDEGLRALGIVNPPEDPAGVAIFLLDSGDGVDMGHGQDAFAPLQTTRVAGDIRRTGTLDSEPTITKGEAPTYIVESTGETTLELVDPATAADDDPMSKLPESREAKREMVNANFIGEDDRLTVQNYVDHEAVKNENGYAAGFGADIKRIRGEVVDAVQFGDRGLLTLTDDTVYDEDDIPVDLVNDRMRTPGLQVDIAAELLFGEGSVVDVYGYLIQRDDGQYQLQGLGAVPIVEFEYDDGDYASGGSGSTDDAVDENTI